jgi:hypothetical protein
LGTKVYGLGFGETEWSSTFVSHPMKFIIPVDNVAEEHAANSNNPGDFMHV